MEEAENSFSSFDFEILSTSFKNSSRSLLIVGLVKERKGF